MGRRARSFLLLAALGIAGGVASLKLPSVWIVQGKVLRVDGTPAPGLQVVLETSALPPPLERTSAGWPVWHRQLGWPWLRATLQPHVVLRATTDVDGGFNLRPPAGGVYTLELVDPTWKALPVDVWSAPVAGEEVVLFAEPAASAPAWLRF